MFRIKSKCLQQDTQLLASDSYRSGVVFKLKQRQSVRSTLASSTKWYNESFLHDEFLYILQYKMQCLNKNEKVQCWIKVFGDPRQNTWGVTMRLHVKHKQLISY